MRSPRFVGISKRGTKPCSYKLFASILAGATILILSYVPNLRATAAVGLSQGKLSAQPSGGVSYQMPIVVAPGTAGMQPKLSLQYSSGGRNGALGMGWSIGGSSAVTRAPQTLAQDNAIH